MLYLDGLAGVAIFVLWVVCVIDIVQTPPGECRNLPKFGWLILAIILPLVGSLAWLVAGRPQRTPNANIRSTPDFPEYERLGRAVPEDPAADAEFLRQVRERAEAQREAYRRRLREEQQDS